MRAYASLITSDTYGLGALVLGHSIKLHSTQGELVLLHTRDISSHLLARLAKIWDKCIPVDSIHSTSTANLKLLGRPELACTFTKFHLWKLEEYEKIVYIDADAYVLKNVDELFEYPKGGRLIAAAPDMGWPDCFNSGVMVFRPSSEKFHEILEYSRKNESFDGGDQGILNDFFPDWDRFSFAFNMTPGAAYSYRPAYKRFGDNISIVHFAGGEKPWNYDRYFDGSINGRPQDQPEFLQHILGWWLLHDKYVSGWSRDKGAFSKVDTPWTVGSMIGHEDTPDNAQYSHVHQTDQANKSTPEVKSISEFGKYKVSWNEEELAGLKDTPAESSDDDVILENLEDDREEPE